MKLTFVQVEMNDQNAGETIRELGTIFQDGRATMIAAPEPAVAALPEPKPERKPKQSRRQPAGSSRQTPSGTLSAAVREAIAERPRTNEEILDYVLARGFESNSQKISAMLCYLRKQNGIYKDDRDKTWHGAEEAKKWPSGRQGTTKGS